jgi:L-methionine (R)-S-oxide reductase
MSSSLVLSHVPRETLLPAGERIARLEAALPSIFAAVEGETDAVALQATLACMLWETLVQANWCGFYRRVGEAMLAVGPYQGTMGCLRIAFSRGVCGAAARTEKTQLVEDVHAFPDHIACDSRSQSEVVVPVMKNGRLIAVLDIDSPSLAAFSAEEARLLEDLVARVFDRDEVVV